MSLYETIAARVIGTPLQRPAEWLRDWRGGRFRRSHPELAEWFMEGTRTKEVLRRTLTPATNGIDIGCHIGSFLQQMITMAPRGHHYAVEPVPHKAAWLRRKFPGVSVLEMALGESTGSVEFLVNESQTSYSGLKARAVPGRLDAIAVDCRRLDEAIASDANIGFIKIDVNGAELLVLRGALKLLRRDRPFVLLECTQAGLADYGFDSDQVHGLLRNEAGYGVSLLKDHLGGGEPLSADAFRRSMAYPFQAFNYAATPL